MWTNVRAVLSLELPEAKEYGWWYFEVHLDLRYPFWNSAGRPEEGKPASSSPQAAADFPPSRSPTIHFSLCFARHFRYLEIFTTGLLFFATGPINSMTWCSDPDGPLEQVAAASPLNNGGKHGRSHRHYHPKCYLGFRMSICTSLSSHAHYSIRQPYLAGLC